MTQDLFDHLPVIAEERRQASAYEHMSALLVLRDATPWAMKIVIDLAHREIEGDKSKSPGLSGDWCYSVGPRGLYWDPRDAMRGWNSRPSHLATWEWLRETLGDDPRRAQLIAWEASLPQPNWKQVYRPYEFWPEPETWDPSWLEADRQREGWLQRREAWLTLQTILNDAIEAVA